MEHGSHEDVASTLSELERKLKELEQELETVGRSGESAVDPAQAGWGAPAAGDVAGALDAAPEPGPPPPGATPVSAEWHGGTEPPPQPTFHAAVPPPPRPSSHVTEWRTYATPPAPPPQVPVEEPAAAEPPAGTPSPPAEPSPAASPAAPQSARLDELLRVREELVQTADRLVAELQRVLEELGAPIGDAAHAPAPEPRVLQSGRVAVDAEPFPDLASLSAFEQALSQTPGVGDVYVRSLDSGHARLEVELEHPMALAAELRGCSPLAFEVVDESESVVALRLAGE